MSQAFIPSSSGKTNAGFSQVHEHKPAINASSKQVISARVRRERLLAYHTAVRVLEAAGVRAAASSTGSSSHAFANVDHDGELEQSSNEALSSALFDPDLERVRAAVEAYERDHNRALHQAIALQFIDQQGHVVTPSASSAGTPRGHHSPRPHRSGRVLPSTEIMSRVHEIFSAAPFSYFEDRRRQMLANMNTTADAGGALEPVSDIAVATMAKTVAQANVKLQRDVPLDSSIMSFVPLASATAGSAHIRALEPASDNADAHDEWDASRRRWLEECVAAAVERHAKEPRVAAEGKSDDGGTPHAAATDMRESSQCLTVESWLRTNASIHTAVLACADLETLVLMKALPACLFAGDDRLFSACIAEERVVFAKYYATAAKSDSVFVSGLVGNSTTPQLAPRATPSLQISTGSVMDDIETRNLCDDAIAALQLRASQRAERSLGQINANRLFLLAEIEQSRCGSNVSRLLAGQPLVDLVSAEEKLDECVGRSASAKSHRQAETLELQRERRKREALRPPRHPLQAVATSSHCWLSLTTAKLRQLPLHACTDFASAAAVPPNCSDERSAADFARAEASPGSTLLSSVRCTPLAPRTPHVAAVKSPKTSEGAAWLRTPAMPQNSADGRWNRTPHSVASLGGSLGKSMDELEVHIAAEATAREAADLQDTFSQPEPTILPIVEMLAAVTSRNANCAGRDGRDLQQAVGPVEMRLLLTIATSYAAIVQSLYSGTGTTAYGRFLERNRDRMLRATAEVITDAAVEFLDRLIATPGGHRGLPRPNVRDAATTRRSVLATLRPFGRRIVLSKDEVTSILSSSDQHAATGGVVVGNEHDAHRAAVHALDKNRAVLHEVLCRLKGEVRFLLTGVDGRARTLEEEQIAIEQQHRERSARKPANSLNGAATTAGHDQVATHHAVAATAFSSLHRGSFAFVPKGTDIVGHTNKARFQAMIEELVGSSSEEEEQRQILAEEDVDISRPVFDWQRQNFSFRHETSGRKLFRRKGTREPPASSSPNIARLDSASSRSAEERAPHQHHQEKPTPTLARSAPIVVPALDELEIAMSASIHADGVSDEQRPSSSSRRGSSWRRKSTETVISPTAASASRSKAIADRLAERKKRETDDKGMRRSAPPEAPTLSTPRNVASQETPSSLATAESSRRYERHRLAHVISPTKVNKTDGLDDSPLGSAPKMQHQRQNAASVQCDSASANGALITIVNEPLHDLKTHTLPPSTSPKHASVSVRAAANPLVSAQPAARAPHAPLESSMVATPHAGLRTMLKLRPLPPSRALASAGQGAAVFASTTGTLPSTAPGHRGVATDRARVALRAPDTISMSALQRELVVLERNRRRAGRSTGAASSEVAAAQDASERGTAALKESAEDSEHLQSVTVSVVGDNAAAATVEKFKKACNATIQHLYGASRGTTVEAGSSWYEQGRSCAGGRTLRAAAIRGVQHGSFDLHALTPIAALRLAVGTKDGGDTHEPQLSYLQRPHPASGRDLLWTL